jgi:hypothetical protein
VVVPAVTTAVAAGGPSTVTVSVSAAVGVGDAVGVGELAGGDDRASPATGVTCPGERRDAPGDIGG